MQMIVLASVIAAILYVPYDFVLLKNIERVPKELSLNTVIGYEKFELSISIRHVFLLKTVAVFYGYQCLHRRFSACLSFKSCVGSSSLFFILSDAMLFILVGC